MERKILNQKFVKTNVDHKCFGCGRHFFKGTVMNSASCKLNGTISRKYFCEACHHEMSAKNLTIDKFWYGDLLKSALLYEKTKRS